MQNSVLRISNQSENTLGTGFVIKTNDSGSYIATCGHVIKNCGESILVDGLKPRIISNTYSEGLDLAILFVEGLNRKAFEISLKKPKLVKVIGYSRLLDDCKKETINNIITKHDIEITTQESKIIRSIKLYPNESICEGYSGSPVICEESNGVVGIINLQVGEDENYAISSSHLQELFDTPIVINDEKKYSKKISIKSNLTDLQKALINQQLKNNLENALSSFTTLKNIWVTPILHTEPEDNTAGQCSTRVDILDIIKRPRSVIIKARQQYGATSLAHYLIKSAWDQETPSYWLYLDSSKLKPHRKEIHRIVEKSLTLYGLNIDDVECIVLDEFSTSLKCASSILDEISSLFYDKALLVMYSEIDNPLLSESINLPRSFEEFHLWALDRKGIRQLVNSYNKEIYFDEENRVLNKVVSDLDALNIPRTPQNCLTILKISEIGFDDSPVNRTEMIRRVLYLLFNIDDIPHYKTRPDLKDTEFTLGYFCEQIIRNKQVYFTRDGFIRDLNSFCEKNQIELDVHIIFDVLYANNIIVMRGNEFCFKFTYWIFYFASHRMLQNPEFSEYILENFNYVHYPELIEFYTGIDRRRDDALKVIINDIHKIRIIVENKCNLPEGFNIYDFAKWQPTNEQLKLMQDEVSNNVVGSNLPDTVKDEYADRTYDRSKPLKQSFHTILEEYSLLRLMQGASAAAVALRNSDYSCLELRQKLLDEVLNSWKLLTNVLVALAPILAQHGYADVEGAFFTLSDDFKGEPEKKLNQIVHALPSNVHGWYVDKLFSQKMGPLIKNRLEIETNNLVRHYLNLILISKRPKDWETIIEQSIISEDKNSYYLLNILRCLKSEYKYGFTSQKNVNLLATFIKMAIAKHQLGIKKPTVKRLNQIPDNILPERHI